jgi:hypothetical protein
MRWLNWDYKTYRKLNQIQLDEIANNCFQWLYTSHNSAANLINSFEINNVIYYGYSEKLKHVKVIEFAIADAYVKKFQKTKNERDLLSMIACYYRPADPDINYGNRREKFIEDKAIANVDLFEKQLPRKFWYSIFLNYVALRHNLQEEFKEVFTGTSSGQNFGIPGMVHEMSGPELGTIQHIENEWDIRNLLFIAKKIKLTQKKKKQPTNS